MTHSSVVVLEERKNQLKRLHRSPMPLGYEQRFWGKDYGVVDHCLFAYLAISYFGMKNVRFHFGGSCIH